MTFALAGLVSWSLLGSCSILQQQLGADQIECERR